MPRHKITRGCLHRSEHAKAHALDAHKLIEVLRRMEQEEFHISLPRLMAEGAYRRVLKMFGLNEPIIEKIVESSVTVTSVKDSEYVAPDGTVKNYPPHVLKLPETLLISDFAKIHATKEAFYLELQDYRSTIHDSRSDFSSEIKRINTIMNRVFGIKGPEKGPEKECAAR